MNQNVSIKPSSQIVSKIMDDYAQFQQTPPNGFMTFYAKTDGLSISIYTSGKVLFQGENASSVAEKYSFVPSIDKPSSASTIVSNHKIILPQAGSDEVGTGDVFGPVVVVATYIDESTYPLLQRYNVTDSKAMNDSIIEEVAPQLMELIPYSSLILDNLKYNQVHEKYNLNELKAILHNSAYLHLRNKLHGLPELCVVDQFAPENLYYRYLKDQQNVVRNLTFQTKAESSFISVACASVIARYLFIQSMNQLSKQVGLELHKGAGDLVDKDIASLIKLHGKQILPHVAKCHFKNIIKVNFNA